MKKFDILAEAILGEGLKGDKDHRKIERELFSKFDYKQISEDIPQMYELVMGSGVVGPIGSKDDSVWAHFWAPYIAAYMIKNKLSVGDVAKDLK